MIFVQLNKEDFEYDIHSLVKAFYPSENVSIYTCADDAACIGHHAHMGQPDGQACLRLYVSYLPTQIRIALSGPDGAGRYGKETAGIAFAVDYHDRRQVKNLLKQNLYGLLSDCTGRTLPWGTLTGIRPVKIPMSMMEEGKTSTEIESYMQQAYGTSKEKISLSIEIAGRELELLRRLDYEKGYSLYIGIPFCPSTCLYCSFTSYPISLWEPRMDEYLGALEKEIEYVSKRFDGMHLNSIYIGGGTPTTLTPAQLRRLFTKLGQSLDCSHLLEFTVEAGRPDSITEEKLKVLRHHNVSRISINPQTMKAETLKLIGRRHTPGQAVESFRMARSLGFDNINMDLIMGLPEESLADVQHTMEELQALAPDSITVHSLAVKRAAKLKMFKEDYAGLKMVNTQEHLDTAAHACRQMGMSPYYLYRQKNMVGNFENIGYAKKGKEGIYNILIMEEKQTIAACGAGSISKRVYPDGHIERSENVKDVASFIDRIDEMIERKRKLFGD